jgi:hypothetical protein
MSNIYVVTMGWSGNFYETNFLLIDFIKIFLIKLTHSLMVGTAKFESLISHPATGFDTEPVPTTDSPNNFKIYLNIIYYLRP